MAVQADIVALQALGWIAGQEDVLGAFMGASGLGPSDLRDRAADPEFLASVLDFLLMDDAWIVAFCDAAGLPYTAPSQARAGLPGGQAMHWT
ncbi:MAG: DUF3572 domain-containing protein [Gemmobacter sp.]|nr:DUF3572 domain-containing protein [Gemmobacter sp.]